MNLPVRLLYYYPCISSRAATIFVGQVGNLRRIVNPPATLHHLPLAAMWGSQSWLQPPFRRLPGTRRCRQTPAESRLQPGLAAPLDRWEARP